MQNGIQIKGVFAVVGGWIAYWLGGLDSLCIALIATMTLDYLTGVLKAVYLHKLSSTVGFAGIAKKVIILSVVALTFIIENVTEGALPLREVTIMFFLTNESISIIENAAQAGIPIPKKLREALEQLRGDPKE